jgi:hypothetical protein
MNCCWLDSRLFIGRNGRDTVWFDIIYFKRWCCSCAQYCYWLSTRGSDFVAEFLPRHYVASFSSLLSVNAFHVPVWNWYLEKHLTFTYCYNFTISYNTKCNKDKGKVVPMLNWAPCYENVWGSGGIAPHILNHGTRWRWVVSFTPRLLYPRYP